MPLTLDRRAEGNGGRGAGQPAKGNGGRRGRWAMESEASSSSLIPAGSCQVRLQKEVLIRWGRTGQGCLSTWSPPSSPSSASTTSCRAPASCATRGWRLQRCPTCGDPSTWRTSPSITSSSSTRTTARWPRSPSTALTAGSSPSPGTFSSAMSSSATSPKGRRL